MVRLESTGMVSKSPCSRGYIETLEPSSTRRLQLDYIETYVVGLATGLLPDNDTRDLTDPALFGMHDNE